MYKRQDLYVGDDVYLITDSAVLGFGADKDTTLTHTDGTGLTLNSTNKICFNDASQFIQGSSNAILALGATDEIDLTATAVDLNGTLDVSGTGTVNGVFEAKGGVIFNEGSADVDFRVESNGETDMIMADGGVSAVGINCSPNVEATNGGGDLSNAVYGLQVAGASGATGKVAIGSNGAVNAYLAYSQVNAGGSNILTSRIEGQMDTTTAGSEAGSLELYTMTGGSIAERMRILSAGNVGIGVTDPDAKLEVNGKFKVSNSLSGDNIMSIENPASDGYGPYFKGGGTGTASQFVFRFTSYDGTEKMRMDGNGNLLTVKTSADADALGGQIEAGGQGAFATASDSCLVVNRRDDDGVIVSIRQGGTQEGSISSSGSTVSYSTFCGSHWSRLADNSKPTILRGTVMESIATMMDWYQAVADVEEVLYVAEDQEVIDVLYVAEDQEVIDGVKNVGDVKEKADKNVGDVKEKADQVKENIALPDGKSVGDAVTFTHEGTEYTGVYVKEDNEQLPMCKVSDASESKAVYGVFMGWDDADDGNDGDVNDMYVAALGAFVVRVHSGETVAIGDYLQSNGDGTAKVQADDIMRASTIAKVTSTEKTITHGDGSYCVPCTLHCG